MTFTMIRKSTKIFEKKTLCNSILKKRERFDEFVTVREVIWHHALQKTKYIFNLLNLLYVALFHLIERLKC